MNDEFQMWLKPEYAPPTLVELFEQASDYIFSRPTRLSGPAPFLVGREQAKKLRAHLESAQRDMPAEFAAVIDDELMELL